MAWAKLQSVANFSNSVGVTSITRTLTPNAVNNLIVVAAGSGNSAAAGAPSISDTQSHTWNAILAAPVTLSGVGQMQAWWALAKNTSATTITISVTTANNFINALVDEFSGNNTSSPLDQKTSASAASGNPSAGPVTTAADAELVWAASNDGVTAVGAGFTKGADDTQSDWSEFKALGTGTNGSSQSAGFTGSGGYLIILATFKPLSVGSHLPARRRTRWFRQSA